MYEKQTNKIMENLLELKDVTLIPSPVMGQSLKTELDQYFINDQGIRCLPIFTSPSPSIVSIESGKLFSKAGIRPILPRNIDLNIRLEASSCGIFSAYSIKEVHENFILKDRSSTKNGICIDSGNGHDLALLNMCKALKRVYRDNLLLMVGNVASPEAVFDYVSAGVDYIRVGISSGSQVDKSKFAYHYPTASLLMEIRKKQFNSNVKIIVDGGISNFSDLVKCYALGADYVMLGKMFAEVFESGNPHEIVDGDGFKLSEKINYEKGKYFRKYKGNSPKDAKECELVQINYSLSEWLLELKQSLDYSFMMSNSKNWSHFKTHTRYGKL